MGWYVIHETGLASTHLALSNGVQPTGLMLSSIKVRRYTVVARSFHGRPRKHLPFVTAVALASGDWVWPPMLGRWMGLSDDS